MEPVSSSDYPVERLKQGVLAISAALTGYLVDRVETRLLVATS